MQTTYYKSYRSAPHAGNIIHLSQLRRRQDLAQRDSLARQPEEERWASETDSLFRPVVLTITPESGAPRLAAGRLRQLGRNSDDGSLCPADAVLTTTSCVFSKEHCIFFCSVLFLCTFLLTFCFRTKKGVDGRQENMYIVVTVL